MKCPYQKDVNGLFAECTIDCPACIYETEEYTTIKGRKYPYQSNEEAIEIGTMWRSKCERHKIVGCKFVNDLIKPTDQSITNIKNVQETNTRVVVNKSIF